MGILLLSACSYNGDGENKGIQASPTAVPASANNQATTVNVIATTNIVADWASNIGDGGRVKITSLLSAGTDPHSFVPTVGDVAQIVDADLILSIGPALEDRWFQELIRNASDDHSKLVVLGEVVGPIELIGTPERHGEHGDGLFDPHFWFDPQLVKLASNEITARLSELDPHGSANYIANASAFNQQLDQLDQWIEDQIDQVPTERRILVT